MHQQTAQSLQGQHYPEKKIGIRNLVACMMVRTNSSYLMYKKTSSGQRWAFSTALMTFGILMREKKSLRCSITATVLNAELFEVERD
jgi:hypothetical protein